MIVPDANLLLYAYDSDSPFHEAARNWWEATLSGEEGVGLTPPTVFAFLRIATSARVYESPMSLSIAARHVRSWIERPNTSLLPLPITHLTDVLELLQSAGSSGGNLVTDAQIAALARSNRGVVYTADQDFRRFSGVPVAFPLSD